MTFSPSWRTTTVVALARQIRESRDYGILPILADALQDAGCDDPTLAALRDEGIVSPLSGLWLAGCLNLQKGPCPTCGDRRLVFVDDDEFAREYGAVSAQKATDCPTCPIRERWDRCPCPACDGTGSERYCDAAGDMDDRPCRVCGGAGDLMLRRDAMPLGGSAIVTRNIYDSLGPLPVVSARVEELSREEECGTCAMARASGYALTDFFATGICPSCSGTGRIWVPSEWLRSLPPWYDVTLEGVEPMEYEGKFGYPSGTVPMWVAQLLIDASGPNEFFKDSPAAARLELCRAIRRWRFTS